MTEMLCCNALHMPPRKGKGYRICVCYRLIMLAQMKAVAWDMSQPPCGLIATGMARGERQTCLQGR